MGSWPPRLGGEWWGRGGRACVPPPPRPGAEGLTSGQGRGWGRSPWGDVEPLTTPSPAVTSWASSSRGGRWGRSRPAGGPAVSPGRFTDPHLHELICMNSFACSTGPNGAGGAPVV